MDYWVLQANPNLYRISDALRDAGAIRKWIAARYRRSITPGDKFARVHSRVPGFGVQLTAGSGGSQGFPSMAARTASSAAVPWAAAESR